MPSRSKRRRFPSACGPAPTPHPSPFLSSFYQGQTALASLLALIQTNYQKMTLLNLHRPMRKSHLPPQVPRRTEMKFGFRWRRARGSRGAFSEVETNDGAGVAAVRPEALCVDDRAESSSTRTGSEREEPEPTAGSFSQATRPAVPRRALWLRRRLRGSGSPGPGRSRSGAGRLRFRLGSGGAFGGGRLSDRRSAGRWRRLGRQEDRLHAMA